MLALYSSSVRTHLGCLQLVLGVSIESMLPLHQEVLTMPYMTTRILPNRNCSWQSNSSISRNVLRMLDSVKQHIARCLNLRRNSFKYDSNEQSRGNVHIDLVEVLGDDLEALFAIV
jgi:hypothetical protein